MDERPLPLSYAPARDTADLLYGDDTTPGIVAVEQLGGNRVRLYRRAGNGVVTEDASFRPWLLAELPEPWQKVRGAPTVETLVGDHPLRYLVEFPDWSSHLDAVRSAQDAGERFFRLRSPVEQYLVRSRRTLFKEMVFSDLKRLQIDIETTGLDPHDPDSQIIVVAVRSSLGTEKVLSLGTDEAELLERVTDRGSQPLQL
jgi:DNA polymerase I